MWMRPRPGQPRTVFAAIRHYRASMRNRSSLA
jgi:hypothetical protein